MPASSLRPKKWHKNKTGVRLLYLTPRQPPLTVADLALRLELDLLLGRRNDFIKRLQKALDAATEKRAGVLT